MKTNIEALLNDNVSKEVIKAQLIVNDNMKASEATKLLQRYKSTNITLDHYHIAEFVYNNKAKYKNNKAFAKAMYENNLCSEKTAYHFLSLMKFVEAYHEVATAAE